MFEQSAIPRAPGRKTEFVLVTTVEIAIISAVALIPLFQIPALVPPKLPAILHYRRSVPLVAVEHKAAAPRVSSRLFTAPKQFYAPRQIPQHVMQTNELVPDDAMQTPLLSASIAAGSDVVGASDFKGYIPPPPNPVAKKQPATEQPLRVASGVQEAKLIHKVIPVYPKLAIETRQQGSVRLLATVGKDGRVKEIRVLNGPAFLATAAVEAVKQWVYKPTLLNGQPVEVIAPIDVNFVLNQ